jgi:hypothetical protein
MKKLIIALSLLVSSHSFAAKCVVSGFIKERSSCYHLSTKWDMKTAQACEALALTAMDNKFFGLMESGDKLLVTTYKFVDRDNGITAKKKIKHSSTEVCIF